MRRSFRFLLRPTRHQEIVLAAMVEDHRVLYNAALQERRGAYAHPSKTTIRYGDQSAQLKEIRAADPGGQGRWSFTSQQQTLRRLTKAFEAFFRRVKAGQKAGYPRFKGRGWFDTVTFVEGDGARWDSQPHHPSGTFVRVQGVGHLRAHQHRPIAGRVKTVEVTRQGGRWYVVLSCDDVPAAVLEPTGRRLGVDMGVVHFATLTEPVPGLTDAGGHIANPRYLKTISGQLSDAQRALARNKRGSNRRRKQVRVVVALHRKVARQRVDHAHKTALALVRHADLIVVEDLRVANMTKAPAPRSNPDGTFAANGAAAKAGLNKSILDAGWSGFLSILSDKAESAGRLVISVSPANTSRTCPGCGHVAKENRPTQAEFVCVRCGHTANADVVGATNVLRVGRALREAAPAA